MKKQPLPVLAMIVVSMALPAIGEEISQSATGQSRSRQQTSPARGSIKGRVIADDGQPMVNARVFVRNAGIQLGPARITSTDDKGEFQVDDLESYLYQIGANMPGYVDANALANLRYSRVGDSVSIILSKGGVITGTVTSVEGEPVVAVRVRAMQVRDGEGRPLRVGRSFRMAETDDRGIYRLYGLPPGSYIVLTQGAAFGGNQMSAYAEDAPTYYPSSTRDTATEVVVHSGQEVTGVDIRYRGEKGSAISGSVTGSLPADRGSSINVTLVNAVTGAHENSAFIPMISAIRSFAIYGVHDGEYEIFAQSFSMRESGSISPVRRISVKGADVTGIELSLSPSGSISGRVIAETQSDASLKDACKKERTLRVEENLFTMLRDDMVEGSPPRRTLSPASRDLAPGDKGEFQFFSVDAGRYRFEPRLLGDSWFIRSITLVSENKNTPPKDISATGMSVKAGEKVTGLTITLAEGGAGIEGRVVQPGEGRQASSGLHVLLIPADRENRDNLLRYAETAAQRNGQFKLRNIAPGRYWLLAKPAVEPEMAGEPVRPMFWDARRRASLRKEAEQANVSVELKPCQKVTDFSLK